MASSNGTDSKACPLSRRRCTFSEIVLKTLVHLPRRATMRGRSRVKKETTRFMPMGWWAFVVQHLRRSWTRRVSRNVQGAACSACSCSWLMPSTGWTIQWLRFCFARCDCLFNFNLHEEASFSLHRHFFLQPTANSILLKQRPIQNHSAVEDFQPLQI